MESPVVLDKPPEYGGNTCNERGFPFDEEEGSSAWNNLASRHPDIAARLRARPHASWGRKRRPGSQDTHDFGESGFDRFPFDDIPPEFREHFPSHWGRRFNPEAESSQQQTTSTQTEAPPPESQPTHLPQYGLRNTVDLGQKSPADPGVVDDQERNQRSASAPPEATAPDMNQQPADPPPEGHSNVRHIPIFVEGRDEPVINKSDIPHSTEPKNNFTPPNVEREQQYFPEEPTFSHPPNFSRPFGTFGKGFRQNAQPFTQQKVYPQSAFSRDRSQSPRPQTKEPYVKVPVHVDPPQCKPQPQAKPQPQPQHKPQQQPQPKQQQPPQSPQQPQPTPQQQPSPKEKSPEPSRPTSNDPITTILAIQTDVLNLMTEVENFTGTKKDKRYLYLDEMLTRNLIKLDNIETDGKENIRQARREAIKCIQKCIAVLEAKADGRTARANNDVEMKSDDAKQNGENGEVEMQETKETEAASAGDANQTEITDTRPEGETKPVEQVELPSTEGATPPADADKKTTKKVKKIDKNKEKKADVEKPEEVMQVDKPSDVPHMEVDGAAASQ